MRRIVAVLLLVFGFSVSILQAQGEKLTVDGLERTYQLHLPADYDEDTAYPLVIALHGGGGNSSNMINLTKFNDLSDSEGFIVVYPDGIENHWNDGRGLQDRRAQREDIDDVNFIRTLIDHLSASYNVDSERVYATGISNGGHMSFRLACELSDRIAAIGVVVANLSEPLVAMCQPKHPVSVLIINGTTDPLIPFEGGDGYAANTYLGTVLSAEDSMLFWVEQNECPIEPEKTQLPDAAPFDGTRVLLEAYEGCAEDTTVQLYTVVNGGHTWPQGPQYAPRFVIGRVSRDINGSETIWDFFSEQRLDG